MHRQDRQKFIPLSARAIVSGLSDKILRLWDDKPDAWLRHREILTILAAENVPRHRSVRGVKRLLQERKLERRVQGKTSLYRPRYELKDFDALDYLASLHSAASPVSMIHEWGVGGWVSFTAAGSIVGFPPVENEELSDDERLALNTILVRMSELFSALMDLRDVLLIRRAGGEAVFTDDLARQVILECHMRWLDKAMGRTDSLFEKLNPWLGEWIESARHMCDRNMVGREDPTRLDAIPLSLSLVHPFEKLLAAKKRLRAEGINVDRFKLPELAFRLRKAQVKMDEHTDQALKPTKPEDGRVLVEVPIPERISDDLSLLGRAYAVKLAEVFARAGLTEIQDMALVMTRHPNTMETQMTTERMLSEFIEMLKEFHKKKIVGLAEEELARFIGGEFGEAYHGVPPDEVEALRGQPWLKAVLGDHFDAFLSEYRLGRIRGMKVEREERQEFERALRKLGRPNAADELKRQIDQLQKTGEVKVPGGTNESAQDTTT